MTLAVRRLVPDDFEPDLLLPAASFRMSTSASKELGLERFEDDLDFYSAAFFRVGTTLASVQRHDGSPEDEYSIFVDTANASVARSVAHALIEALDVSQSTVSWDDLRANFRQVRLA